MNTDALNEQTLFGDLPLSAPNILTDRFLLPPFTSLDARSGEWQRRKARWAALGLVTDAGRDVVVFGGTGDGGDEVTEKIRAVGVASIFDPVLTELSYAWYTQPGAVVFDPFAGGPVRGVVAGHMGRGYVGIDLSIEQVAENHKHLGGLPTGDRPVWYVGDSRNAATIVGDARFDFAFTCPPYGWLERYSDDPADLSTMDAAAFLAAHREIIAHTASLLREDRFATWVVGDFRDRDGCYIGFPAMTVLAFARAGMRLYNEAVLLTAIGSVPVTASVNFGRSRKLGKVHQNVLTFVKGDPRAAARYAIGGDGNV